MSKLQNAVLITGAGQRIGYFLAKQFLATTDYPVVFTYRSHHAEVDELQELGAVAYQIDLTDAEALVQFEDWLMANVISLRGLIHNASQWTKDEWPIADNYQTLFKLHVDVPYQLNQACLPLLLAADSVLKDIISLSDFSVLRADSEHIAYLASKAAMQSMSKGFAKKFAPAVKVNDIAPALILFNEGDSEKYKQRRLAQSALGIEPGAVVVWQAVQYLMNSAYTTGTVLPLEGGRALL